ncbi:hypothetical protein V4R08_02755 [Nitrobacter sp. NHB1]|uniref:hypothetical protein n=1 Tax=Nitrobacter sp. NHB1 TaxID=3119830 RepID=UPI002FFFA85F
MNSTPGLNNENQRELKEERGFKRMPWRERKIVQRAGWVAALVIMFANIVAAMR